MSPSTYIGILLIALIVTCALGFSWVCNFRKKKENKKQLQKFNDFVINNHLTIDSKQRINNNIIGIDRLNYVVVFLNNHASKIHVIQLRELKDCRLIKHSNTTSGHIIRIFLKCIFLPKDSQEFIIPFYNETRDGVYMMMPLSQKAGYWARRINLYKEAATLKDLHRSRA